LRFEPSPRRERRAQNSPKEENMGYKPSPTTKKKDALKTEHPGMKTLDSKSKSGKKSWAQTEMVL